MANNQKYKIGLVIEEITRTLENLREKAKLFGFLETTYWVEKIGRIKVGINYTDNIDLAYQLKEKVEKELGAEVLFIFLAPPIIGANSGPGTLLAGCLPAGR